MTSGTKIPNSPTASPLVSVVVTVIVAISASPVP
jgi:hypothetical protein